MTGANWGRWGVEDERGALNRITASATQRGIAAVRTGESLALAVALGSKGPIAGMRAKPQHFMTRDGGDYACGHTEKGFGFADDVIMLPTHGTTHIDALSHIWAGGQMWNGFSANTVTSKGAQRCSIEKVGPIVTRGVFVDLDRDDSRGEKSGEREIPLVELQNEIARREIVPQEGDALIIRTGWLKRWRAGTATEQQWSGLSPECAEWIDEQGFAVIAADNIAVEYGPSTMPCNAAPMHVELMRNRGVFFMELLDLEVLAARDRCEFLFVVAPLPIVGGVGSPVNPVAVL